MQLKEYRLEKGWTQEQLAQHAGLSARTIQRLERGEPATLETLKCLAAALDTSISALSEGTIMTSESSDIRAREADALEYVQHLKGLAVHAALFCVTVPALGLLNWILSPHSLWVHYAAVAWLFGLGLHGLIFGVTFGVLGADWERRVFKKRLNRHR